MLETVVIAPNSNPDADAFYGKYKIISELGEGAMGKVYKCFDPDFQRMVAVKTVHKALLDNSPSGEFRERFRNEMRAAGTLNHPNIVTVYDAGEKDGCPFFVMEYVEGQELKHLLDEQTPFTVKQAVQVIKGVLCGLSKIHKKGIVHRDLKPANIFITADGTPKIADFGIAKLDNSEMTQVGTIIGSPKYMSPEQCIGEPVDARSDLFSLGIIFYELLAGRYCFSANSTSAISQKIINVAAPPPSTLRAEIPGYLDKVIAKALAKKAADRFQSADEFLAALDPSSQPVATSRFWLWPVTGLALTVLIAGAAFFWWPTASDNSPLPQPLAEQQSQSSPAISSAVPTPSSFTPIKSTVRVDQTQPNAAPALSNALSQPHDITHLSPESTEKMAKLFKVAASHKKIGRLVSPSGSNAYDAYQIILSIDPGNAQALQGIEEIKQKLLALVSQSRASGDTEQALINAKAGREVFPDTPDFALAVNSLESSTAAQ